MAAPKPIGGAEKCVAHALVEGVHDDARGAGWGGGDQVVAASGLRGEEVAFPGNVGVEVGAEIGWKGFFEKGGVSEDVSFFFSFFLFSFLNGERVCMGWIIHTFNLIEMFMSNGVFNDTTSCNLAS